MKTKLANRLKLLFIIMLPMLLAGALASFISGLRLPIELVIALIVWFLIFQIFYYLKIMRIIFVTVGLISCLSATILMMIENLIKAPINVIFLYVGLFAYILVGLLWFIQSSKDTCIKQMESD